MIKRGTGGNSGLVDRRPAAPQMPKVAQGVGTPKNGLMQRRRPGGPEGMTDMIKRGTGGNSSGQITRDVPNPTPKVAEGEGGPKNGLMVRRGQQGDAQAQAPAQPAGNGLMVPRPQTGSAGTTGPAPAPVTTDREGNPVAGVSGRLHGLLKSDSPYLERARYRGRQHANRRGLSNSSIAAGASEAAAIDAALPIAQSDANIAANERAMRSTEYQQARAIRSQELMQERGLSHDAAQREADRELRESMQQRDLRVRQLMQERGLSHDAAQRGADRELMREQKEAERDLSKLLQERDHRVQQNMQTERITHDAAQRKTDREMQSSIAAAERRAAAARQAAALSHSSREAERSRQTQIKIAKDSAVRDINAEYNRRVTAISLNTQLPAEERRAQEKNAAFIRDESMKAHGNVYNYKPKWTSARRPQAQA